MATSFHPVLFKVVTPSDRYAHTLNSALVKDGRNTAHKSIDYKPTIDRDIYLSPVDKDTPILCFTDAGAAYDFADKHTGRHVYEANGVGEVVAVTRVLVLKAGWAKNLSKFWAAVRAGEDVGKFAGSRAAPAGTVALFGHIRLLRRAARPVVAEAAVPNLEVVGVDGGPDDGPDDNDN